MIYAFGDCELDLDLFELRRDGTARSVEPQVFDVLAYLVAHRDRVVTKAELLDSVWDDRFVSESALTSRLKAARRAVGDDGRTQGVIRTVHGRGYRFVAPVEERPGPEDPAATAGAGSGVGSGNEGHGDRSAPDVAIAPGEDAGGTGGLASETRIGQEIRFCDTEDGTCLAYSSIGTGPPLVKAANWLSHLDFEFESPVWRHWMLGLSRRHRLIRYDERGCGMSDWDTDDFTFDAWVRDLESIVDACGLDRFPLLGISQGGSVALSYAVRHPERVSALVLYGAYSRGRGARVKTEDDLREAKLMLQLVRLGWGRDDPTFRQVFTSQFIPEGTREQHEAFNELQRRTTSAENAVQLIRTAGIIDVAEDARRVQVPTLILHARDDRCVPLEEGRRLAGLIPGSRFVTLDSMNHVLLEHEPAWPRFLAEVEGFLDTVGADG